MMLRSVLHTPGFYLASFLHFLLVSTSPIQQTVFAPFIEQHAGARGKNAAVACESDVCSQIGITLNEAGGNAADMVSHNQCRETSLCELCQYLKAISIKSPSPIL